MSDAGKNTPEIGSPSGRWIGQIFRTLALVQQQAENSRKRILFGMNNAGQRRVAYWGIDTPPEDYGPDGTHPFRKEETVIAAQMRTRLNSFSSAEIDLLLKAGYAGCSASLYARDLFPSGPQADFSRLPLRRSLTL